MKKIGLYVATALHSWLVVATPALAIKCGNSAAGFNSFKKAFGSYARSNGVGKRGRQRLSEIQLLQQNQEI